MTTTDQQAVTAAQDDRSDADLLRLIAKDHARLAPNACHSAETLMQIADRLASVSSASAEAREQVISLCDHVERFAYTRERTGDMDASPHFLAHAVRQLLAASPEPVPATNQAGYQPDVKRIMGKGKTDYRDNLAVALFEASHGMVLRVWSDKTRAYWLNQADAALATQPATSQEGEDEDVIHDCGNLGWCQAPGYCSRHSTAATPTPPTLSEDLREVLVKVRRYLEDKSWDAYDTREDNLIAVIDAALAQVQAS